MKIKFPSRLSAVLPPLIFLSLLLSIFGLVWFFARHSIFGIILFFAGASTFIYSFKLMLNLETSWQFSPETAEIFYLRQTGAKTHAIASGKFADIAAIYVQGRQNRDRIRTWWNYKIMMLYASGREKQISDFFNKNPDEANKLAQQIAEIIGCKFVPAREEKVTLIRSYNQSISVNYADWSWAAVFREFWQGIIATILLLAVLTGFVVGLVFIISG